jgi:hypothetical protein
MVHVNMFETKRVAVAIFNQKSIAFKLNAVKCFNILFCFFRMDAFPVILACFSFFALSTGKYHVTGGLDSRHPLLLNNKTIYMFLIYMKLRKKLVFS